ncbi:MAG: PhzF family phenazine biosynthesis protein [Gemmobacter sp.]|uniref:PhzF family phenazine biosynthesis protein n=1 Tax=Gemmobacter sp. TaxID=1898957 RepID=UPI00391CA046
MQLEYHILDVFTDRAFSGNPLAVVLGADGLSDGQMRRLAREFNLSETIFVQAPADPAHAAQVRIWFPTAEIPFAGHPTIGCAVLLAELRGLSGPVVLEERAGLVPVTLRDGLAELTAPVVPHAVDVPVAAEAVAAALGLDRVTFAGVFGGGPQFLFARLPDLAALAAASPREPLWSGLMAAAGVDSIWAYVETGPDRVRARMFSPTAGIPEDPATGSATAILAAVRLALGQLPQGESTVTVDQGVEMGRPSRLRLTAVVKDGGLVAARVAGRAVRVAQGRIRVPEED